MGKGGKKKGKKDDGDLSLGSLSIDPESSASTSTMQAPEPEKEELSKKSSRQETVDDGDEEGGLNLGGGGKKRRKKKKLNVEATPNEPQPSTVKSSNPTPSSATQHQSLDIGSQSGSQGHQSWHSQKSAGHGRGHPMHQEFTPPVGGSFHQQSHPEMLPVLPPATHGRGYSMHQVTAPSQGAVGRGWSSQQSAGRGRGHPMHQEVTPSTGGSFHQQSRPEMMHVPPPAAHEQGYPMHQVAASPQGAVERGWSSQQFAGHGRGHPMHQQAFPPQIVSPQQRSGPQTFAAPQPVAQGINYPPSSGVIGRGRSAGWGQPMHQEVPQSKPGQQAAGSGAIGTPQPVNPFPAQQQKRAPGFGSGDSGVKDSSMPSTSKSEGQQATQQTPTTAKPSYEQKSVVCRFQIPKKIWSRTGVPADKIRVLCNYLPMTIKPYKIHRYDVAIKPDRPKKLLPKVFQAMKGLYFPKNLIAFDMVKNCYALKPLIKVDETFTKQVEIKDDNGVQCKFEIALKFTGEVDFGSIFKYMKDGTALSPPTEAIHCIDVILRQGALENYVKASRQYFLRPRNPIDLGDGLEMWTGLFQSAIFTSRPFINIDVAHKGFPRCQPLIDTYRNDFRLDVHNPIERQRKMECQLFVKFIRGLRVNAMVGDQKKGMRKREFICNDLKPPANVLTFSYQNESGKSETITVEQYFSRIKGCRLRYPNLNCVWVGPRNKEIYYPMELLEVTYGQALNRQLNDKQLSKMVREAATPPSDRKRKIEEVIRDMKYSSNDYFKEFGLEISNNFYEVDAKILRAPILNVGEGTVQPRRGVWQARKLLKASALQSWGFLVVEADPNRLNCPNIIQTIQRVGRQMGMEVREPGLMNFNVRANELHSVFRKAVDSKINFLFVIISSWAQNVYQKVKKMAELEVGILTQCIKDSTAERRMNEQTIRNILLKVNSKLMGVNQTLENRCVPPCIKDGGVMVVGADVTHPSPDQTDIPSIAAVTASFDTKCFQYNTQMSIQTPKKEMIVDFENMMVEHLKVYKKFQNALPRKIFIFRDGVSEGQFAQVMNSELVAVYKAFERLAGPNTKPEVLFLLVQKRHHTRFFLGASNAQNVEPGTVVDKDIVHNSEMDFYMVSHQAIKGTARPTRYYGVRNDGNISIEEVEQLTYYLCHLFSRCTRAVSYPTPTYYAHLACTRAKNLTFGDRFNNRDLEIQPRPLPVLDRMLNFSRMFFV